MAHARLRAGFIVAATLPLLALVLAMGPVGAQEKATDKAGLALKAERKLAFDTDEGTWVSLDVAPDGRTIVFELAGDMYTLPIGGGDARAISTGMAFDSQPRYSPDGTQIAFLSDRDGAENVWVMKADGSGAKALTKEKQAAFASPAWTEDGQGVIVSRNVPGLRTFELWIYDTRGGSGVQVTKAKASKGFDALGLVEVTISGLGTARPQSVAHVLRSAAAGTVNTSALPEQVGGIDLHHDQLGSQL